MNEPAIKFVDDLYTDKEIEEMLYEFREKGYVVLPDVLQRESVEPFSKQLSDVMVFDGLKYTIPDDLPHYIHCLKAPRVLQVLPSSLSHSVAKPYPSLHTTIIIIETDEMRGQYAPDWHKDREPDGMPSQSYHYPLDVFVAFYYEDITEDHGPTMIVPGSHRDLSLTPYNGSPIEPIYCRKQDALLLDQRAWHRGTPRKAPGTRFLIVYGLYAMPHFYGANCHMPLSQRKEWLSAQKMRERILYGGPFAPPDLETLEIMKKQLEEAGPPQITYPRQA